MSTRHRLPEGARIKAVTASGSILVIAEEREDVAIEPETRHVGLSEDGHRLEIKSKSSSLVLDTDADGKAIQKKTDEKAKSQLWRMVEVKE